MAVPGLTPRFPVINVGPVLVTVEPPKTAKLCAAPRSETVWATSEDIDEASTTKKIKDSRKTFTPNETQKSAYIWNKSAYMENIDH